MTAEQFVYWLQGFIEIENPDCIPLNQTKIIKDHLALVFNKKTPPPTSKIPPTTPQTIFQQTPTWQAPHYNLDPNLYEVEFTTNNTNKPIC